MGLGFGMMGAAAGAGDAIQQLFQQRMEQARLASQQNEFQQNQDRLDALMRLSAQERADSAKQKIEEEQQREADRHEQQNRLNFPLLPRTGISPHTVQQMTQGPGGLPADLFPRQGISEPAPPEGIAAPDQPVGDQPIPGSVANAPAPSMQTFNRVPTPDEAKLEQRHASLKQLAALFPVGSDRSAALQMMEAGVTPPAGFFDKQTTRVVPIVKNGKPQYVNESEAAGEIPYEKPQSVPTVTIQTIDAQGNPVTRVIPKSEALGKDFAKGDPAQIATQKANARNVQAHVADIRREAADVNKVGLMGPIGGRWADFMAGKIGSSSFTDDPKQAELLDEFRTDVGLLKSGMAMVHGGARGGGSPAIMARMDALINANKMDLPLFTGSLNAFDKWLKQYAGGENASQSAPKEIRYDMNGNPIKN